VLVIVSLIPLSSLFRAGLPVTHDGQDHVARIANFYQSLSEGNLVPRWAANLNWGYGHPILIFLYPLPSYLASFFHFLNFSLVDSTKIVFGLSFFFSGIFMYLWVKEFWGVKSGFVSGLIYLFAPYRFVDLYVRGAIGECWAFVWPPLVCWFALKLAKKVRWYYLVGGALSLAALILSHNALSLMFLPIIFGYMGYLVFTSKQRSLNIKHYLLTTVFGFAVSAFFWLPALIEGKYTLRNIVTHNNLTGFSSFQKLLWSPWSYGGTGSLSVQLGILQWLGIIVAPWLIWKFWQKGEKIWIFLLFLLVCFWLAVMMILPISKPIYLIIPLLSKFQFAWRFLSLAIFSPAILLAGIIFLLPEKFRLLIAGFLLLAVLFLNYRYWQPNGYFLKNDSFYTRPYSGTTDTGESAPRWSVRFMEKFPKAPIEAVNGEADAKEIFRSTTKHIYQVRAKQAVGLVENTLYFPGWRVSVNGNPAQIQFQDPAYRGLITFSVPAGENRVIVFFGETKLRWLADLISLAGLAGLGLEAFVLKWKEAR